jgi:hypothetical protein
MFGDLELATLHVEAILDEYLVRAILHPRGDVLTYMNDRRRPFIPLEDAELFPLSGSRQLNRIRQQSITFSKRKVLALSVPEKEETENLQLLASKRSVVFYVGHFAVQGDLHVNKDARDDDLLDETRDFFALTEASVYPISTVATAPTSHSSLLLISRIGVSLYHTREK